MEQPDQQLHIEVGDPRAFVRRVLQESGHAQLFEKIDDLALYTRAAELVVSLAEAGGADLRAPGKGAHAGGHELEALWAGKYFINVPAAVWATILASLSIIVAIAELQVNPGGVVKAGVALLTFLEVVRKIPKKLQPEDIPVFLATELLTAGGVAASAEFIAAYLKDNHPDKDKWTTEKVQRIADFLAGREILKRADGGFLV